MNISLVRGDFKVIGVNVGFFVIVISRFSFNGMVLVIFVYFSIELDDLNVYIVVI